jgi:hypothetical protein
MTSTSEALNAYFEQLEKTKKEQAILREVKERAIRIIAESSNIQMLTIKSTYTKQR